MFRQLQIMILPLMAYGAIVGFTTRFLGDQPLSCGSQADALISTASACGYQQPHNGVLSPDRKHLVFAEVKRSRVVVLDAETLAYVGEIGADALKWPHDVSFATDGTLYVADSGRDRVAIFAPSPATGTYAFSGELRGDFVNPEGVLAHPNGTIYVSAQDSGSVAAFRNGKQIAVITGIDQPHDINVAPDGGVLVVESGRGRVIKFDADLVNPAEPVAISDGLSQPRAVRMTPQGGMIVTEKDTSLIKIYDPGGKLLQTLGSGKAAFGPHDFNAPEGIELDGDRMWITDTGNGRVVIINLNRHTT